MFVNEPVLKAVNRDEMWQPKYFDVIAVLYVATLFMTWVTAGKMFSMAGMVLSASIMVYPLNSILGDVLTEIYGFNRTRRMIWMGLVCGLLFLCCTQAAISLPPAAHYAGQEAFAQVNGLLPRIVLASYLAYLGCEFINSAIMSKMKLFQNGRFFSLRAVVSTVAAQFVDSAFFFVIGFFGTIENELLVVTIVSSWLIKVGYEIAVLPLTTAFVRQLKKLEGIEQFDRYALKVFGF